MKWLRLFPESVSSHPVEQQIYVENGREMTVSGEMIADGFCLYVSSIVTWNDSNGELIAKSERHRIARNIPSPLESEGTRVVLD